MLFSSFCFFCLSAKSISSPIFIPSGYIFRSSSDKPLSSSSLSHVGRRPVPDQVFSAFLGSRYFAGLCSLGLATPCIFMASRLMPASNFAVSQAGRFPIPVHVLKGLSGSRYTGSPLVVFLISGEPASPSFLQRFSFRFFLTRSH